MEVGGGGREVSALAPDGHDSGDRHRSQCVSLILNHIVTPTMSNSFSRPIFLPSHHELDERSPQGSYPQDLNASVTLPPEILDKILEHLPADRQGRQTLIACALVATWWMEPSRRRLFSSVEIHESNYKLWMNGVVSSGSKAHLLKYVRSLSHSSVPNITITYGMRDLARDSGGYLSGLHNLQSLTMSVIRVEYISGGLFYTCFSAFRDTLTLLSLIHFTTSLGAFVALVNYFPNIKTLELFWPMLEPDEGPVPSLSRPLRGRLFLLNVIPNSLEFFNQFAKLDLEYDELAIDPDFIGTEVLESALRISTRTVRFLRLTAELDGK